MSILIKNGRVITATDDYVADIYIEGETVQAIGTNLDVTADEVIDASGKLVMPGGIDPHVHLEMPFMGTFSSDTYETGTRAALFGGTTTVIDFILQTQGKSLQSALNEWKGRSDNNAVGDYSFHMAVRILMRIRRKKFAILLKKKELLLSKPLWLIKAL